MKRGKKVVYEYAKKLEKWEILSSEKENNQKVYRINKDWR